MADNRFYVIENYIYLYHLLDSKGNGTFLVLPTTPEEIADSLDSNFQSTSILARTTPIFTYSNSGPREVQISLPLHRDMMYNINTSVSNMELDIGEDYVDKLINYLQAIALPTYAATSKMVNPPMVAVRFGDNIFIKGVVNGGVTVHQYLPLLEDGRYAHVNVQFTVSEVDPYDAKTVVEQGSLRGLSTTLERILYRNRGV